MKKVAFSCKDRKKAAMETMTIDAVEFIRRFLLHVLPKGFMRIRHYGFLANRCKNGNLKKFRKLLGLEPSGKILLTRTISEIMLEKSRNRHHQMSVFQGPLMVVSGIPKHSCINPYDVIHPKRVHNLIQQEYGWVLGMLVLKIPGVFPIIVYSLSLEPMLPFTTPAKIQRVDNYNGPRYSVAMIQTFKTSGPEDIFDGLTPQAAMKCFPLSIWTVARRKLDQINRVRDIDELKVPLGNRLERLKVGRENRYSIWINKQYRICFTWEEGNACDVEITDYH